MPLAAQSYFANKKLEPAVAAPGATIEFAIKLLPSLTLALGTLLGEVKPNLTLTISATGGTFTLSYGGQTTTALAFNAAGATVQAALVALSTIGAGGATVTGAGPYTILINGVNAVGLTANGALLTGGAGTAVITNAVTGVSTWGYYNAYASGNSDGSQIPTCILPYAVATDASSNITLGTASAGGEFAQTYTTVDAYFGGWFNCADVVGLDANALTATVAFILRKGNIKNGILQVG